MGIIFVIVSFFLTFISIDWCFPLCKTVDIPGGFRPVWWLALFRIYVYCIFSRAPMVGNFRGGVEQLCDPFCLRLFCWLKAPFSSSRLSFSMQITCHTHTYVCRQADISVCVCCWLFLKFLALINLSFCYFSFNEKSLLWASGPKARKSPNSESL